MFNYFDIEVKADEITDEDIRVELSSGIAMWRGRDKMNRPSLIVTGRLNDNIIDTITVNSFRKVFLIENVFIISYYS